MQLEISVSNNYRVVSEDGHKAVFEFSGLYPGYGTTLGNALRRVLLSSLPGAAITYVSIPGVAHEFSTLPGVKETILDVALNLKKLRFKLFSDEPQTVVLNKKGEGPATSEDIKAPSQVRVISKGVPIATLTDKKAELSLEMRIERGIGYVPAEVYKNEKIPVGTMALDAIFTPIYDVTFRVENMRVGDRTDYNRLLLTIETDGSLSPQEALVYAADILVRQFSALVPKEFKGESGAPSPLLLKEPVSVLGLSQRSISALERAGIKTISGLSRKSEKDLSDIEGIGAKGRKEIIDALSKRKISLKD